MKSFSFSISPRDSAWLAGLATLLLSVSTGHAGWITAGELVVDLRAMDLNGSSSTWTNRDTTGNTVGNFVTKGGGALNVTTLGGYKAVNIGINLNNALLSASQTPTLLEANSTRSVEAWIYPNSTLGGQAVAGWGQAGTATMSSFRYANNTGNGMFSGWYIDAGWSISQIGQWKHVAWTYDGTSVRGYINGMLINTVNLSLDTDYPLKTTHNKITLGAEREAATGAFDGCIAEVRVHTGVLSAAEIANNYSHGIQSTAPTVTGLSNQTVHAGDALMLNAAVSGFPQPMLQWQENGSSLANQTNAALTVANVQTSQDGHVFSLVASNAAGVSTQSMTLTVVAAPAITDLNSQAVEPGATVPISPTITGLPAPSLQWLHNGSVLADGLAPSGASIAGSFSATLWITNAQTSDSGTYSLVASNAAGVVTNSMTLTVSSGNVAPQIAGPMDQTVVQGNDATFTASISGLPLPAVQWQRNGSDISGATGTSLVITNVQYARNGELYSVIAGNTEGAVTNSARLYVLVPPAISQEPTNTAAYVGSPALFSVTAAGVPAVSFQWRKNGSPIAHATNATCTVASVTGANNGEVYSVVVSNSVGTVTSSNAALTALSTLSRTFQPANGATGIAHDQQLRIVFPEPVRLGAAGTLTVRDAASHSVVATIDRSQFLSYVPGNTSIQAIPNAAIRSVQGAHYYYMPIAIYDNEVWITLPARLAYNRTYYVNTDTGLLLDTGDASIRGVSDSITWRFSTKPAGPATPTASAGLTTISVGQDGTGDFATFQGAFDWIPQNNTLARTIRVKAGIYRDNATLAQNRNNVTLVGEGQDRIQAQLVYPFAFFAPPNTVFTAGSLRIESSDVKVLNLTLDNIIYEEYHPTGESSSGAAGAFAGAINTLATKGRRIVLENVLIKGGQDTIFHDSSTGVVYFHNCEVWGSVDYIYGSSLAVYDQCDIVQIRSTGGPITAPNTSYAQPYGLVFLGCAFPRALVANGYPYNVNLGSTTFQRPWGQDGATAIINCQLDSHFTTKGWAEWGGRETTCRAIEHGSTLPGGGAAPTIAQRQSAGAYWLNTVDPDYTSSSMSPTDALLAPPSGNLNRTSVSVNPANYTLDAIFGHAYFGLGSWRPSVPPAITLAPVDQSVDAGDTASFEVVAVGLPAPAFQWRKNGADLAGQTNSTLTLTNLQPADSATYSVFISNSAGNVAGSAVLTVNSVVNTNPPTMNLSTSGGELVIEWPTDRVGWHLEIQTNAPGAGLTANWIPVANSDSTNRVLLPINTENGSVFLRLVY